MNRKKLTPKATKSAVSKKIAVKSPVKATIKVSLVTVPRSDGGGCTVGRAN